MFGLSVRVTITANGGNESEMKFLRREYVFC